MGQSLWATRGGTLIVGQTGRQNGWAAAAFLAVLGLSAAAGAQSTPRADDLPDAPSARLNQTGDATGQTETGSGVEDTDQSRGRSALRPCKDFPGYSGKDMPLQGPPPCMPENPISPIVTSEHIQPL